MAVTYPIIREGMYCGQLTPQQQQIILQVKESKEIESLKQMIFDFPIDLVIRSIEETKSIRDILREENKDLLEYLGVMRDFQTVGTGFLYFSPTSILGDSVGQGKTVMASGLINLLYKKNELGRFLMAVDNNALWQVQAELVRFTGLNIVSMLTEEPMMESVIRNTDWSKVDGLVIKHSALSSNLFSRWLSLYIDDAGKSKIFQTFLVDESSVIKNLNTKVYDYSSNICNLCHRKHFFNATVFEHNIMEVYNQLDILNPLILPKKWRIEKEFCNYTKYSYWITQNGKPTKKEGRKFQNYKNQEEFRKLIQLFYFGRPKQNKIEHNYKVYEVYPTIDQSLAIAKGYRYREVLNSPSNISQININLDRKSVPKLNKLIELLETELYGKSVMVYCFHINAQEAIAEEAKKLGRRVRILNGSTKEEERNKIRDDFNNGKCDLLITNIKRSLNLFGGEACVFYTVETNPAKIEQIGGRIDRNVDDLARLYILLVYKGTEEYNFLLNVIKQRSNDAKSLTIDAKTTIDYFLDYMENNGSREG